MHIQDRNPVVILQPTSEADVGQLVSDIFERVTYVEPNDIDVRLIDGHVSDLLPNSVAHLFATSTDGNGNQPGRGYHRRTALVFMNWLNVSPAAREKIVANIRAGLLQEGVWVVYVNTYTKG